MGGAASALAAGYASSTFYVLAADLRKGATLPLYSRLSTRAGGTPDLRHIFANVSPGDEVSITYGLEGEQARQYWINDVKKRILKLDRRAFDRVWYYQQRSRAGWNFQNYTNKELQVRYLFDELEVVKRVDTSEYVKPVRRPTRTFYARNAAHAASEFQKLNSNGGRVTRAFYMLAKDASRLRILGTASVVTGAVALAAGILTLEDLASCKIKVLREQELRDLSK